MESKRGKVVFPAQNSLSRLPMPFRCCFTLTLEVVAPTRALEIGSGLPRTSEGKEAKRQSAKRFFFASGEMDRLAIERGGKSEQVF